MFTPLELAKVHDEITPEIQSQIKKLIKDLEKQGAIVHLFTEIDTNLPINRNKCLEIQIVCEMNNLYISSYFCVRYILPWLRDDFYYGDIQCKTLPGPFKSFATHQELSESIMEYLNQ